MSQQGQKPISNDFCGGAIHAWTASPIIAGMKIFLRVELPDKLAREFWQQLRDFDVKHDPRHEDKIMIRALSESDHSAEEMETILRTLSPPPKHMRTIRFDS